MPINRRFASAGPSSVSEYLVPGLLGERLLAAQRVVAEELAGIEYNDRLFPKTG